MIRRPRFDYAAEPVYAPSRKQAILSAAWSFVGMGALAAIAYAVLVHFCR